MCASILEVIHEAVVDGEKPAKQIAEELGKQYPTFMREINPADEGAKFDVSLLLPLMNATNNDAPLEYLAHRRGYRLVRFTGPTPDKPTLAEECLDTYPAISRFHDLLVSGASQDKINDALAKAILELEEDRAAGRPQ